MDYFQWFIVSIIKRSANILQFINFFITIEIRPMGLGRNEGELKKYSILAKTTLKCFKNGLDHTSNSPRASHTQRSPSEERRESFP